ncbi:PadR family transcriptional regulator [Peribacillus frigoritolerans]|uniref:PadR family transcriptional regulator n=1 Tax=Peribacillus frigoritolerans TaxID=450367 RepID=UPI0010592B09|nr:PadR family transcriptional regulator [Peribacillus frigoritolerans]TDL82787.1 PadR family transcriptional regulator [Peribacillus frigoritolerans]
MEDRLKRLKKLMDQSAFAELTFTEKHRNEVREKIEKQKEKDEDILLAVLHLLVYEKTGHELTAFLRSRGVRRFEGNEGALYTLLHQLEQKGWIGSAWNDSGSKHYQLKNKGKKLLQKAEAKEGNVLLVLKEMLEG